MDYKKIVDLSIEELTQFQRQLDGELAFFNDSMSELKAIANKFGRCQTTLSSINKNEKNKEALVPLSDSVGFNP